MARLARIVLPGVPHHITQRGNRRERVFFEDSDYALYLDLLAEAASRAQVAIWAYCLIQPGKPDREPDDDSYGITVPVY
jgi:putative transposase